MVNKKNFEQELELELEMELEREEILKKFATDKEEDEEGVTDKLSQSAVKSLVESFDKDVLELTETQVMIDDSFEGLDEDFKNQLEEKFDEDCNEDDYNEEDYNEEDTVLVYNTNVNILELDDMDDITDMKVLPDKTLDEMQGKYSKGNKIKKYYMVAVFSILVGFTFVIILLILYTRQQNALPNDDNLVADASSEVNYDSDYVNKLINQNQELFKEVGDLRKEVARLSTTSSANVIEEPQMSVDTGAQSVVELPPLEEIEQVQQIVEEAQPVVQVQKPPAEQVSKKPQKYTVQKGDTLFSISRKFYGSIHDYKKISSANELEDDKIKFGDVLIIP